MDIKVLRTVYVLLVGVCCVAGLRFSTGAYENFVLKISEDIPSHNCKDILKNLESTLGNSSEYLFSALDGRAFLRSVTVLLPASWPDECAPGPILPTGGHDIDLNIVDGGQSVWTQQSGGCGQPGDLIYMNYQSLLQTQTTLSRLFIKEFAKYRYGVFDEQGYIGDPVYPICYKLQKEDAAKVTGCSDLPIKDDGICNESELQTRYNISLLVDSKARTSIMFGAEAPSISMFCDEGNHDRYAPTKHNFMCDRRSTLDVILQHADFLTSDLRRSENAQVINTTPSVMYGRRLTTRYVLIIENTQEMLVRESWKYLRNAVRKWAVYDLPKNSEVSLITVNDTAASLLLQPTSLVEHTARDLLASNVPYTAGETTGPACLHCALKDAIEILQNSTKTRGAAPSVILILASAAEASNERALEQAHRAKDADIRIVTVNYPMSARQSSLNALATITGGRSFEVRERRHNIDASLLTTYFELTNVMYSIALQFSQASAGGTAMPVEIHRREIADDGRNVVTGSFVLDESMGEPARFSLFTHNVESPLIKSVTLISPSQEKYWKHSDSLLAIKVITVAASINETGTWTYRIERWPGNPQPHYVQVMATPREPKLTVNARFWIRQTPSGAIALHAEVKRDLTPVLAARVTAYVTRSEANGTLIYSDEIELLDTGSGDPDTTKGDGIYSKYFAGTGPGSYTFHVKVSDNGNTAYCSQDKLNAASCCGSFSPTGKVQPLSPFERILAPTILELTSENTFKVSNQNGRIGDLRAQLSTDRLLRLSWTAPDMAGTNVARYEVRYARSVQDITDKYETAATVWDHGQPYAQAAGSETTFTLNLTIPEATPLLGEPLYFAIKAFPQSSPHDSQAGRVSNWIRVLVPKPPIPSSTRTPEYSTSDYTAWPFPDGGKVSAGNDLSNEPALIAGSSLTLQLILPIAGGAILLLLILTVYCYFCILRKKSRHEVKKSVANTNTKLQSTITIIPNSPARCPDDTNEHITQPEHEHAYSNEIHAVGVPLAYQYEDEPKKRYSLVHQQEQQLIEELQQQQYGGLGELTGVSVISAQGNTLQRTLSPYESWSASQLLHEHERRHSPLDDPAAPHMEHYNILIPPPVPPLPQYTGYPLNYNIYGVHQPPAPQLYPPHASLQGSLSSVNSAEKKKRNVTMV